MERQENQQTEKNTLKMLEKGQSAIVTAVGGEGELRQHFLDMGLIPGVEVKLVKLAPMGDPMELQIRGYELTLRLEDAKKIAISKIPEAFSNQAKKEGGEGSENREGAEYKQEKKTEQKKHIEKKSGEKKKKKEHPGFGEGGRYHTKTDENPLPKGTVITFALAGNQNCGKTTLFNQLTGSNQHVGNFPGVTVDRKDGCIKGHSDTLVTDLPGIYSMSPYTKEEIVTREFLLKDKPKGIINIVDASNIERNLYLTMQLMELNVPIDRKSVV